MKNLELTPQEFYLIKLLLSDVARARAVSELGSQFWDNDIVGSLNCRYDMNEAKSLANKIGLDLTQENTNYQNYYEKKAV
jgi:hypothetical protein